MEDNKIEEAAKMYAFNECSKKDIDQYDLDGLLFNAFCSGINWFLGNLWHDASEEPEQINKDKEFAECLVQFKSSELNVLLYDPWRHWWACNIDNEEFLSITSRWLYIKDLMKGGK